jgi:hypothetical protein
VSSVFFVFFVSRRPQAARRGHPYVTSAAVS